MRIIKNYNDWVNSKKISESIVDKVRDTLSNIFTPTGQMKDEVRENIKKGIDIIRKNFPELIITDYFVIGAAVTYQYSNTSDIDTTVVIDQTTSKEVSKTVDKWIETNLDKTFWHTPDGTQVIKPGDKEPVGRPYQFKINKVGRENITNADSAYDSIANNWIKKPNLEQSRQSFDIKIKDENSLENRTYSQMEKWVQPYLQNLYKGFVDNLPINQIKTLILKAFNTYEEGIKNIRSKSYSSDVEHGMSSKNWGKGNVIYKMFDKEGYNKCYEIMKNMKKTDIFDNADELEELKNCLINVINDEIGYKPLPIMPN